jgi:glycosyltransferase involved in cell wall biosynthesis
VLLIVEASFAGVGRHVLDLAEGLIAAGHHVDLLYGAARAEDWFVERSKGLAFRRVATFRSGRALGGSDVQAIIATRRFVRGHGPYDVVHGHASKGGAYARLALMWRRRTLDSIVVYTPNALVTQSPESGRAARAVYATIERRLARRTDGIVHVSPEEADHATRLGLHPRRSVVIPNGIPLVALPDRDVARDLLGLRRTDEVIGFVGRLSAQKSVETLLEAFALVRLRRPGARLAIIGDGEERDRLEASSARLGVEAHVSWLGKRAGQSAMPAFDVFALPSRYEGFPYVLLEALWAGVAAVATTGSCASVLLGDGRCGVIVPREPIAFAAALVEMLEDPSARRARGDAGRERARVYSVDSMVGSTLSFYEQLISTRRA